MKSALKTKPIADATEKGRLIQEAHDYLVTANGIDESKYLPPGSAVAWYDAHMAGVTDIKTLAGAMEIEMRTRKGLAVIAEGERRGGRKVSGGPTLSGAEKTKRHEDRLLAKNQEAVGQYVKDSIEAGEPPSVTTALRLVKPTKPREAEPEPVESKPEEEAVLTEAQAEAEEELEAEAELELRQREQATPVSEQAEPNPEGEPRSATLFFRVTVTLRDKLLRLAEERGTNIDQLVIEILEKAVA